MSDHNHEDPLNSILNGNNEATEDNASTSTPDLSLGLIDTVTTNKLFQLSQNFIHSQGDTADNTDNSAACGGSSIPDNNTNGTDSVQDKSGDTPQDKCAEELEQDYKKVVQKGPPIDQQLANVFQDLAWGIFKQEKWDQVISGTIPPENLESLDVTKANKELRLKISHGTKSFDLSFQKLQDLILKSICITSNLANELYSVRSSSKEELNEINSKGIQKCADAAMLIGKLSYDLLTCRRELIIPELNSGYRQTTFVQGDHPKLLFGDHLPKAINDISETNKVGQALKKQHFVPMNYTPSNQFQPQNFSPRGKPFLYQGRGKKGNIR